VDPGETGNDPADPFQQFVETGADIDAGGPVGELLDAGARTVSQLLQDTCFASLLSDGRWLQRLQVADPDPDPDPAVRDELEALARETLRERGDAGRQALSAGKTLRLTGPLPAHVGIGSAILAPMRARDSAVGLLAVFRHRDRTPHTADDERLVQVVADWLAAATTTGTAVVMPAVPAGGEPRDLTGREQEVLALLALGHTNREIAERLFLSVRTIEWHRSRIQWKLRVTGRAALTRRARALGLID
jgi:DNA-binding CsgD family transcriptional regulator